MNSKMLITLTVISLTTGCAATGGPSRLITAKGLAFGSPYTESISIGKTGNLGQFYRDVEISATSSTDIYAAQNMLISGFAAIHDSCNDFFSASGSTQVGVNATRDITVLLTGLVTSTLALQGASKSALSNVAIGGTVITGGLDLYTKNYLFGAENVESVRALTTRALVAHRNAVYAEGSHTFQTATSALIENQAICELRSIADLAKSAIANGTVTASKDPVLDMQPLEQKVNDKQLRIIGSKLAVGGAISRDQALLLWWYLVQSPTQEEVNKIIGPGLKELKVSPLILPTPQSETYVPNESFSSSRDSVIDALDALSSSTLNSFPLEVSAIRAKFVKQKEEKEKGKTAGSPALPTDIKTIVPNSLTAPSPIPRSAIRIQVGNTK